jgi:hypothetical protein
MSLVLLVVVALIGSAVADHKHNDRKLEKFLIDEDASLWGRLLDDADSSMDGKGGKKGGKGGKKGSGKKGGKGGKKGSGKKGGKGGKKGSGKKGGVVKEKDVMKDMKHSKKGGKKGRRLRSTV